MTEKQNSDNQVDVTQLQHQDVVQERDSQREVISEEFIKENMPTVESVASSISSGSKMPPGVTYHDLVSWGVEGLIKAKSNYKSDKGTQFRTYAYYRIRGEILDKLRREWSYRSPSDYKAQQERIQRRIQEVAEAALNNDNDTDDDSSKKVNDLISSTTVAYLLSIDDIEGSTKAMGPGAGDPAFTLMEEEDWKNQKSVLFEEINELEEDEKQIIELFYIQDFKQKEIAEKLHLSRSKVCRLHMKILKKLKRRLMRRLEF